MGRTARLNGDVTGAKYTKQGNYLSPDHRRDATLAFICITTIISCGPAVKVHIQVSTTIGGARETDMSTPQFVPQSSRINT